ncbi:MAG: KpsF/GutQ family sugar-phosphate isomerase [Ignavibacteriales bacterium]|nr:KpsF/GutQ family sugar-phosphate isomerase [Ignavibacteriales bacterium]MCB9219072.1 KpsF/GutQ family sugar-phosphate isomerase [Ignavibacteriales bacterium]MCB9259653.1 KpsF/GutQ family sugar-phosphate isomerase [Ignavibacteriales bacterium]
MTDENILEKGKKVIDLELGEIAELAKRINGSFVEAVRLIYESNGRVVFTGMGKSGLIARKIVATLNSTGTAAIYMHPTDALHGDLGMVRKGDIAIIISKSGATEELINLISMFKRMDVKIIGFLGNGKSKIAKECDIVLDVSVKEEACPHDLAPTSSTTVSLVLGDALAVAVLELRGFTADDFALLHPAGSLGKRLSLKISEIMYKGDDLPIVKENALIKDTILEMTAKRLGATCIINESNKLIGIVTDGDLRRQLEKSLNLMDLKASDIMSKNPKTIKEHLLASFALQKMESFSITSLIVVNENDEPIGLVHLHDLVKLGLQRR